MARLGREILLGLENPGADWVKLEVLGDTKTLLPDPDRHAGSDREAGGRRLSGAVLHERRSDHGPPPESRPAPSSVMPAGSPIGSGQGILNPNNIRICLEYLKDGDPDYPVIVDAGVGTASDVTIAMELGVDGVLLNTGIAHARDPLQHGPGHEGRASKPAGWPIWPAAFPRSSTPRPAARSKA